MSKEKKFGFGKFLAGAAVGAGLGLLFAPKKGSETRADLKTKIDDLVKQIKNIDVDEVKEEFEDKLEALKEELAELDKEKVLEIAKNKSKELKNKAQELVDLAIEKGSPILRAAADAVREKAVVVTRDVLARLEKQEKVAKKETK